MCESRVLFLQTSTKTGPGLYQLMGKDICIGRDNCPSCTDPSNGINWVEKIISRYLHAHGRIGCNTLPTNKRSRTDRKMEVWSLFCDETDLYGQVYVVRVLLAIVYGQGDVVGPGTCDEYGVQTGWS